MNVYVYDANIYCEDCGDTIRREIEEEGHAPDDLYDEHSYDSNEYPTPYPDGGGVSDTPEHCGGGGDCVNAIELSNGMRIGAWLENKLTAEGVGYVQDAIREGGEVAELWAEFYADYDL